MRKIAVITGTRADYGLLYWIMKGIQDSPELDLQLIVTGTHLSPEFGLTVKEIERDRFVISERVEMLLSSDTETAISTSMGLGMIGFARAYERLKPNMLVVLGDRFEILSAVAAAVPFRIPVAHIHGGEATEGAMDEQFRHAITKMSHIHFTAAEKYRINVIQMGEKTGNVYCFGAPGLDNIYKLNLYDRKKLYQELQIPTHRKAIGVVTYHPVTLENDKAQTRMASLVKALREFGSVYWVFTLPNADTGGRVIIETISDFVKHCPDQGCLFSSLGRTRYLSLLKHASVMVGNSSSGIIEAPSFELPVVNIGPRQSGRVRGTNVLDVPDGKSELIARAIERALSSEFRRRLKGMVNPYGRGHASRKIVEKLKSIALNGNLTKKQFCEFRSRGN